MISSTTSPVIGDDFTVPPGGADPSATSGVRARWKAYVQPAADGLPRLRVLFAFPALLAVGLIVLVGLGITGSSTGFVHQFFETAADERLLSGQPQAIRSDEWSVQTAWTISQSEQGYPVESQSFPGGFDTTVQSDLPSTDWSIAFRPHLAGFLFLPLDNAMALKWWFPAFAMIAAVSMFLVVMMPRRPVTAALLSIGFFFAPFFQWWFLPVTFWPVTWAFLVMAGVVWLLRRRTLGSSLGWGAAIGYATVTTGMGVYVPFIVPVVVVAAAFGVGVAFDQRGAKAPFWPRLASLTPILIGGVAALAVLGVWVATRWETIERFTATVYPGQRLTETGGGDLHEALSLFGAPMTEGLGASNGLPLGANASEASTFFLVGLFLLVPLGWIAVARFRLDRRVDWLVVAVMAAAAVMLVFIFVPGWDAVAHALLLDRTTEGRMRIGLGVLSIVIIGVLVNRLDGRRIAVLPVALATAASVGSVAIVAVVLQRRGDVLLTGNWEWLLISALMVAATFTFARNWPLGASALLLIAAVIGSAGVNPLYQGVYNLNDRPEMSAMKQMEAEEPGTWVGVGDTFIPNALLIQSGMQSYNGFQGAPSPEMWAELDPDGRFEQNWNRLANVSWVAGDGEPTPTNPAPDQIQMNFDSCSDFAQEFVTHVVSDGPLIQSCLEPQYDFGSDVHLYQVAER